MIAFHPAVAVVLARFALPRSSIHGPAHWGRVLEHGLHLAEQTGANVRVVALFAILHDSCRLDDRSDPFHGPVAAKWLRTLDLGLATAEVGLLARAVAGPTTGLHATDPTIATCWDADRLDISRTGARINPAFLSITAARHPTLIAQAQERGAYGQVPDWLPEQMWL